LCVALSLSRDLSGIDFILTWMSITIGATSTMTTPDLVVAHIPTFSNGLQNHDQSENSLEKGDSADCYVVPADHCPEATAANIPRIRNEP
jgi:hypothetical protein